MIIDRIGSVRFSATDNTMTNKHKSDFLSKFHENAKNSSDMTDTVVVPRTIFKGYLGFMAGTALLTIGSLITKPKMLSKFITAAGTITSLYGVYAFVRPYVIRDVKGVDIKK